MLKDMTAPYRPFEAFFYDRFIAPAVAEKADRMQEDLLAKLDEGVGLLDVGSGGGQMLEMLAQRRPDLKLTGLDLSPGQVKRANGRLSGYADRAEVQRGSALELPFRDDTFDAVMSIASIKHWPDPQRGLAECVRVLKPGGRLYVAEADRECDRADAKAFVDDWLLPAPIRPLALAFFLKGVSGRSFSLAEFQAMAANLGLEDLRVEKIENSPGLRIEGIKRG